jgi:hypothetical protein
MATSQMYESKLLKTSLYIFLATFLNSCIEIWRFFFYFFRILAITWSQTAFEFSTFDF